MRVHLVTFSDESMSRSAELCVDSAIRNGVNAWQRWTPSDLSAAGFYHGREDWRTARAFGYWGWKPFIIDKLLNFTGKDNFTSKNAVEENDIAIYADAGIEFIENLNYIIDRMDKDIFLFGNMYNHAHWCKRDIVEAVWPKTTSTSLVDAMDFHSTWDRFGKQVQASVIFFRVNDKTRAFVKEWLDWCLSGVRIGAAVTFGKDNPEHRDARSTWSEFRYLIDDSPSVFPNHPEFRENRHDQAILTTMAYRDGIPLHWWPGLYNKGGTPEFVYPKGDYTDDYPPLFSHHRKRNHEWESAA